MLHAKALHGNPFDGHTLGPVIADLEKLTGVEARRKAVGTRAPILVEARRDCQESCV